MDEKNAIYRSLALKSSRLYPPMKVVLEEFRKRALPMAIATGSNASIADEILASLGVRGFFTMIVSSSEVKTGETRTRHFP